MSPSLPPPPPAAAADAPALNDMLALAAADEEDLRTNRSPPSLPPPPATDAPALNDVLALAAADEEDLLTNRRPVNPLPATLQHAGTKVDVDVSADLLYAVYKETTQCQQHLRIVFAAGSGLLKSTYSIPASVGPGRADAIAKWLSPLANQLIIALSLDAGSAMRKIVFGSFGATFLEKVARTAYGAGTGAAKAVFEACDVARARTTDAGAPNHGGGAPAARAAALAAPAVAPRPFAGDFDDDGNSFLTRPDTATQACPRGPWVVEYNSRDAKAHTVLVGEIWAEAQKRKVNLNITTGKKKVRELTELASPLCFIVYAPEKTSNDLVVNAGEIIEQLLDENPPPNDDAQINQPWSVHTYARLIEAMQCDEAADARRVLFGGALSRTELDNLVLPMETICKLMNDETRKFGDPRAPRLEGVDPSFKHMVSVQACTDNWATLRKQTDAAFRYSRKPSPAPLRVGSGCPCIAHTSLLVCISCCAAVRARRRFSSKTGSHDVNDFPNYADYGNKTDLAKIQIYAFYACKDFQLDFGGNGPKATMLSAMGRDAHPQLFDSGLDRQRQADAAAAAAAAGNAPGAGAPAGVSPGSDCELLEEDTGIVEDERGCSGTGARAGRGGRGGRGSKSVEKRKHEAFQTAVLKQNKKQHGLLKNLIGIASSAKGSVDSQQENHRPASEHDAVLMTQAQIKGRLEILKLMKETGSIPQQDIDSFGDLLRMEIRDLGWTRNEHNSANRERRGSSVRIDLEDDED